MPDFHVPDMTCDGCARAITAAVQAADPAATLSIDLPAHFVAVASARPAAALAEAMREAGFSPEAR
jgi:copper chaperone